MMISLVLLSMLVTAMALATHAALTSYSENEKLSALNQTLSVLLARMRRELRTAESIDFQAETGQLIIFPPDDGSGVDEIHYEFDDAAGTFNYVQISGGETTTQTIMDGDSRIPMTSFYTTYETARDDFGVYYTERVNVSMTFDFGGEPVSIVCSAAPRRNQRY